MMVPILETTAPVPSQRKGIPGSGSWLGCHRHVGRPGGQRLGCRVGLDSGGRLVVLRKPEPNHGPFPGLCYAQADVPDNTERAVKVAEAVTRWLAAIEHLGEEELWSVRD